MSTETKNSILATNDQLQGEMTSIKLSDIAAVWVDERDATCIKKKGAAVYETEESPDSLMALFKNSAVLPCNGYFNGHIALIELDKSEPKNSDSPEKPVELRGFYYSSLETVIPANDKDLSPVTNDEFEDFRQNLEQFGL